MKLTKKAVSYVLVFLMVFSSFTILPSEFWVNVSAVDITTGESNASVIYPEGDFAYSIINDNEVEIVSYNGTATDIVIPEETKGKEHSDLANKKVTAIGDNVFYRKGLTAVTFGKNIKSIGDYAFYWNNLLQAVDLSVCTNLKTIGEYAFYAGGKITSLTLPDSLEIIDEYAFSNCDIISLKVGANIKEINKRAFHRNLNLQTVNLTGGNNGVIGNYAFYQCLELRKLIIGDGINIIGRSAFAENTNLTDITIGNTVTTIMNNAIIANRYSKIKIGSGLTTLEKGAIYSDESTTATIKVYSKKLKNCTLNSFPRYYSNESYSGVKIYCYENSETHKALEDGLYDNQINFLQTDGDITNIKVNSKYVEEFNKNTKAYSVVTENINSIEPIFEKPDVHYRITERGNVYTLDILDSDAKIIDTYKIIRRDSQSADCFAPTAIKINDVAMDNFNVETKSYIGYTEDINNVNIVPVFKQENVKYTVTNNGDVYTVKIFDEIDCIVYKYEITVRKKLSVDINESCSVIGDVTLLLTDIGSNKVSGNIALTAGTYKLKIAKEDKQFGYGKTITDYCSGLTLSEKYSSYITLNATGGTYTFQFDTATNKLIIKHESNMPNEYLVGDIDTILKPVPNRPLSIGTQYLPAGTYKFKVSIGGQECGYNTVVDNITEGSISVNRKFASYITLMATGGLYTFTLNTDTNKLTIDYLIESDECKTDVHISGSFDLVLFTNKDSDIAYRSKYLEAGSYNFKVYNYGVAYTAGVTIKNKDRCTLSSKYTTPITLVTYGRYCYFEFNKKTGELIVR
ncbi:MAG: leucine-rich repeat domain-containing protein [Acutalibacteraceae bacterium]